MLKIKNISSGYGKKQVLYDISLEVDTGEVLLLSGGNGSGKSTLLKCIYNLLPLWTGEIFFQGEKINNLKPSDLIRKGIVYIPQRDFCFDNLTVEENLQIAGTIYNTSELKKKIETVYSQIIGLENLKKRKPFNLSEGEKKVLAFGMGMIHQPKLILFDEPFAGVDTLNFQRLMTAFTIYLKKYNISVIMVEHKKVNLDFVNRNIFMELGKIKSI